jgi:IclR family acetate operon transcriptional repressor
MKQPTAIARRLTRKETGKATRPVPVLDERYRVQSVGRALDLLELVANQGRDGARLTDLARDLSLSKAAAYAILQTLLAHGFIVDFGEGSNRRYRLGMMLARLGDLAVANTVLTDIALAELRNLTAELGMTSRVAILDDGHAVVIGRVDAPGAVRFNAALGRRELPHCSAVGKAMLAALPAGEAQAILNQFDLPQRTPQTVTDLTALLQQLAEVRELGYAVDDEEDTEGVACIGACILDRAGRPAGAISVTSLKQRDWANRKTEIAAKVMQCAARISAQLSGKAPPQLAPTHQATLLAQPHLS